MSQEIIRPDRFESTLLLNNSVQKIIIEAGLYINDQPYYKACMPDERILFLKLDPDDLLWHLESGAVTSESETIGKLIEDYYDSFK